MKRNWYAAAILLVLCLLLYLAGRYVTDTTDAMQAGVQRAYALAEQGDYPAARRAYAGPALFSFGFRPFFLVAGLWLFRRRSADFAEEL